VGVATVDASDVWNPKQSCLHCGEQNDIAITVCAHCGKDVYSTDKMTIEVEDTTMGAILQPNGKHNGTSPNTKGSFRNLFFDDKIAEADPEAVSSTEMITPVHNEGMMDVEQLEEFLDDNVDEGRKERNNNNQLININNNNDNNNNLQHMANNGAPGNRPLFTTILVIYWLYYLVWFVGGVIVAIFQMFDMQRAIAMICLVLPSLILLVLLSRVSCLNSVNIHHVNHYQNLHEHAKTKYKLMSILITVLLMFAALLRIIWWIYCIIEYVFNTAQTNIDPDRLSMTLLCLLLNEFGIIVLINVDYLKMSYFEHNRVKQGVFGIVYDPYPCLVSLAIFLSLQLAILTYASFAYPVAECTAPLDYLMSCGLNVVYTVCVVITFSIPSIYLVYELRNAKHNNANQFEKLSKWKQYMVVIICVVLILLTLVMTMSIFGGHNNWIHLLLLPQLFGISWALLKLKKMSE